MRYISLTKGRRAIVDNEDFETLSRYKWFVCFRGRLAYAEANRPSKNGQERLTMHRVILLAKKGEIVDHINGSGLDNRRSNLRFVTHKENMQNTYKHRKGHKLGTTLHSSGKYQAQIYSNGGQKYLGLFDTLEQAEATYKLYKDKHLK